MTRKVGLYLRISKDLHEGEGVERQREAGMRLIEQRGWELHRVYVDNDISAAGRKRRPDYQALLADLEAGVIDAVAARSFERLCKTRREQLTFVELGQEKRAPVVFTHAPDLDLTTAVGRGMADMMAAWARVEMEQKSERHIDQIAQAARQGRIVGAPRAFGYSEGGLHLDVVEAPLLRQLYDRWLTGESMSSIARWLNEHEIPTPRGGRWEYKTVREVLANPRNAGLRGMRDVVNPKTGTRAQWHRIIGPAVWPAVVSEETWRAALERIKDPTRPGAHVGSSARVSLLTGIALCGAPKVDGAAGELCLRPLVSGYRSRGEGRVLACSPVKHLARRADLIEDYVTEALLEYFRREDTPDVANAINDDPEAPDPKEIRRETVELRGRLKGLARDYAQRILDAEQVKEAGDWIRGRLLELERITADAGRVDVLAPLRAAEDPERVWEEDYVLATRREVVRRVLQVVVLPGHPGRPGGLRFQPETVRLDWYH